ncbi:MAG: aminotransferase class I/II-fold pyridoxal phosphate-dependent enzyme [Thermoplasmata archaeon]|nr:aminotransferase class I/II-fold pyridoxal phosphate-dependent enzyme [Thermoplasmata archaeon]
MSEPERPRRPRFEPLPEWAGPSTRAVHAGRRSDVNAGAVVFPIYQTSTYRYPAEYSEAEGPGDVHLYTRLDNPTQEVAAELLRGLEGAEAARVFGSGMAAISTTLLSVLSPGDEVVAIADLYGGTLDLLRQFLPRFGVHVRCVTEPEALDPGRCVPDGTKLVYLESPTNPLLKVHDLRAWTAAASRVGALTVVDNTLATPVNQSPLALGADLVLHSASKYLAGHSDTIAGAVAGRADLLARIDRTHGILGAPLDPFAAFLLTRGMKTLSVRMERQNGNGRALFDAVQDHPKLRRAHYPGADSDRSEEIAGRQMRGRSGVVAIELAGGAEAAGRFLHALRIVEVACSFGGVESLASVPSETSHRALTAPEAEAQGIRPGLVRLSLGIEDANDLVRDVSDALDAT